MRNKLLVLLVLMQLVIVFFLFFQIKEKEQEKVKGVSIVPLKKETLVFPKDSDLQHFYEPKPDSTDSDSPKWLPYVATYTINKDGLNERFDYEVEKPTGVFRLITLGDSYTFGHFVNTEDNYPERLEDLLNKNLHCKNIQKFEVINLGVPGYDVQYTVHRFVARGLKYNPDIVIWVLKTDDFWEIAEEREQTKDQIINEMIKEGIYKSPEEGGAESQIVEVGKRIRDALEKKYSREGLLNFQKARLEEFSKHFQGKTAVFAILWSDTGIDKILNTFFQEHPDYKFLKGSFTRFTTESKGLTFSPDDGHPNAKGHRIIAEDFFDYLVKNQIIPCE